MNHWNLSNFSRFKPSSKIQEVLGEKKPGARGSWTSLQGKPGELMRLSLTADGHMLITSGDTVFETIFLLSASCNRRSCKVLKKNDVLSFLYKIQHEARTFRVKFEGNDIADASSNCKQCAEILSKYVTVRFADASANAQGEQLPTTNLANSSTMEPSLSQFVGNIMKNDLGTLPLLYQQCAKEENSADDQAGLENLVMLCFTDPAFPSFVGKVETVVKGLISETAKYS